MKKPASFILILIMSLFMIRHSYTQCIPDTIGCVDINEPGQICPDTLLDAYVGVYYEETVTIWPPSEAIVGESAVDIHKIILDSIGNIPPGIDYEINAVDLYPDTAYCVLVTGTPTTPGSYTLYIRVIPFIKVFQNIIEVDPQVDDTSITVNVYELSQLPQLRNNSFAVIDFSPNPFSEHSKIGFYNVSPQTVTLEIFSILGEIIYTEKIHASAGENYFIFDGRYLKGGIYMYKISNPVKSYLGKFTKIK